MGRACAAAPASGTRKCDGSPAPVLLLVATLLPIHQPCGGNDEQRRQDKPEQRVEPHQRDVKAAQSNADPKDGQRSLAFHLCSRTDVSACRCAKNRRRLPPRATLDQWRYALPDWIGGAAGLRRRCVESRTAPEDTWC